MTQSEHKHVGEWRIPTAMVVLLIVLCVAASSWGIWRWMQKPAVNSDAVAVDPPTRGQGRRAAMADQPPGRIFKRDDGSIRAFSGNYYLTITPPNREMVMYCNSGEQWVNNRWLNKNLQLAFQLAQRWSRNGNSIRTMQFTDKQRQQMKLVTAEPSLPLSAAEKMRLDGLIKNWEDAKDQAKPEAQRAVLLAVREIAKANIPEAKAVFIGNVVRLNELLTPEQLAEYRQIEMARRNNKPPTTAPSQGA